MPTTPFTFKNDFDNAQVWEDNQTYEPNQIFRFTPTQTTAVDIDNASLDQNIEYWGFYPTQEVVAKGTTLTLAEIAKIRNLGTVKSTSASTSTATYQGLQIVTEWDWETVALATPHRVSSTAWGTELVTGEDFTGSEDFEFEVSNNADGVGRISKISLTQLEDTNGGSAGYAHSHHLRIRKKAGTDLTNLTLQFAISPSGTLRLYSIKGIANAANDFVIPTATTSKTQIDVSVSGDSTTINSGDANGKFLEGAGTNSLIVDLPVGQSINKTATETAMNAIAGVTAVVTDVINGIIEFTVADGTGNIALPITHVPVVDGTQLYTFQQSNTTKGPTTPIDGWQFDLRNDHREGRIINASGNDRLVFMRGGYRLTASANFGGASYKSTGLRDGVGTGFASVDLTFTNAGAVQNSAIEVWEIDPADNMKFVKLHDLRVSCRVGGGYNNNDWRVEVIPA